MNEEKTDVNNKGAQGQALATSGGGGVWRNPHKVCPSVLLTLDGSASLVHIMWTFFCPILLQWMTDPTLNLFLTLSLSSTSQRRLVIEQQILGNVVDFYFLQVLH